MPDLDAATPSVSVIVPTRDRASELADCLAALADLEYPAGLLEVIVVDDGSADPGAVASAAAHGARLLVNESNRGPAFARNRAAREATGELLAFVDSDCVAAPGWLRALTPYFAWGRVGAVGGRTVGYHHASRLDRYEEVSSSLDMGPSCSSGGGDGRPVRAHLQSARATLRVPGARRTARAPARGRGRGPLLAPARARPRARLRAGGRRAPQAPRPSRGDAAAAGALRQFRGHAPRAAPGQARTPAAAAGVGGDRGSRLRRRRHPQAVGARRCAGASGAGRCPPPRRLRRSGVTVPAAQLLSSTLRGHLSALYFAYFRLVRYYLWPLAAAGVVAPGAWLLAALAVVYAGGVDYTRRRPRLSLPRIWASTSPSTRRIRPG